MNRNLLKKVLIISGIVLILLGGILNYNFKNFYFSSIIDNGLTSSIMSHFIVSTAIEYYIDDSMRDSFFKDFYFLSLIGFLLICIGLLIKEKFNVEKIKQNYKKYKIKYILILCLGLLPIFYFALTITTFIISGFASLRRMLKTFLYLFSGVIVLSLILVVKGIIGVAKLEKIKEEDETEEKEDEE